MKSILLTSVQFICIGWILYTNSWIDDHWVITLIQTIGLVLGVWAIAVMSKSKLNITPVPRKGASLVISGPYKILRHPMYTAVILTLFPILFTNYEIINLVVFGILFINLILKLNYEEILLREEFPAYEQMATNTWRLVPWIY